jgi:hypothetical protein
MNSNIGDPPFNHLSSTINSHRQNGRFVALAALLLCGLSASAQPHISKVARELGFTIPPGVQTPIVIKTKPDAICELHAAGVSDPNHTLKLYANSDGYVQVHATVQESAEDSHVQLDCTGGSKLITYPVRLRSSHSPTTDTPAPQTFVPIPKGSRARAERRRGASTFR